MKVTAFKVIPHEPLYFGPPASLPAGDAHHGESLFPPPSSAWQGTVRTRLLEAAGLDLQDYCKEAKAERAKLVGGSDALLADWSVEGPIPTEVLSDERDQGWFPTPLWVHHAKDDVNTNEPPRPLLAKPLSLSEDMKVKSDLPSLPIPIGAPKAGRTSPLGGWLSASDLLQVLKGGLPAQLSLKEWNARKTHWNLPPFVHWETRPGVALDGTSGTVVDGMLYFLRALRFGPRTGLAGWLKAPLPSRIPSNALFEGTLTVGKKARPVVFEPLGTMTADWQSLQNGDYLPKEISQDSFDFWLYLATSAHLKEPVRPILRGVVPGVDMEVRGTLLHKPLWQGGFSMERGQARPNLPYVPAGSSWFIRLSGGTPASRAQALARLHHSSPLITPSRAAFGEGRVLVGIPSPQVGG